MVKRKTYFVGNQSNLIYLAIPYNHKDVKVRQQRFELATKIASDLMKQGIMVFSPISHSHHIVKHLQPDRFKKEDIYERSGWDFWKRYDELMLSKCDELMIITADGWTQSIGVNAEIKFAKKRKMKISIINPHSLMRQDFVKEWKL